MTTEKIKTPVNAKTQYAMLCDIAAKAMNGEVDLQAAETAIRAINAANNLVQTEIKIAYLNKLSEAHPAKIRQLETRAFDDSEAIEKNRVIAGA